MRNSRLTHRRLLCLSVGRLAVLALVPPLHYLETTFVASVCLILANAVFSLATLTRKRRVLITLNLLQIVLFGVLNYQLYLVCEGDHYEVDHDPGFSDWTEFAVAHVCRAADVIDALDGYGSNIQVIRHTSAVSGSILVSMHLFADVFLLGLLFRWVAQFWKAQSETSLARGRRNMRWFLIAIAVYVALGLMHASSGLDWLLCLADNLLRLLDVGDMFQVFNWSLQERGASVASSICTLVFRVALGAWLADIFLWIHFSCFGGWGINLAELREILHEGDPLARQGAAKAIGSCGPLAAAAVGDLVETLSDFDVRVRCEAARALGKIGPRAARAVPALAMALWSDHAKLRFEAVKALDLIGPAAREATADLSLLIEVGDEEIRKVAARTLMRFGSLPQSTS